MANVRFYTQEQLESARKSLCELPDLKPNKLTTSDVLESLKEQIVTLSMEKGYSLADIKSALNVVGITASEKGINDILRASKQSQKKRKRPSVKNLSQ